ncbi:MAG: dihydroorotate dehydrogenase electron transfer subunit [Anaeroplasmataceae bacterium]
MNGLAKVIRNELIADLTYEMEIEGFTEAVAGQFINIKTGDNALLLRRPISISEVTDNSIIITYKVVGAGTKVLSEKKPGDILDILGPLGNGFPLKENKKALLIGGGIGVPPLVETAKRLKALGCDVTIVIGARDKSQVIYEEKLSKYGRVYVTTDDGSYKEKGNVINCIENNNIDFDVFYACGPSVMLKYLDLKYQGVKEGYISFEERMACGIGICYGCVCVPKELKNGMLRVCKEGPVFGLGVIKYE